MLKIFSSNVNCVYWSFRGLDTLIKKIRHYKEFLNSLGAIKIYGGNAI